MATGLSSAGTGFVFLFIEAMIDAGVQIGLTRIQAQELTLHREHLSYTMSRNTQRESMRE